MNKRGIAPLLATILLIILAAGLGVVVMNFGRAQIESTARCTVATGLQLVELNQEDQLCLNKREDQIFFLAENGPNIPISRLRLRVIGSAAVMDKELEESSIEKAETLLFYVPYDYSVYGEVKQFRLVPIVNLYNQEVICTEQAIVVENVRECK